jgi:hypothetical protein
MFGLNKLFTPMEYLVPESVTAPIKPLATPYILDPPYVKAICNLQTGECVIESKSQQDSQLERTSAIYGVRERDGLYQRDYLAHSNVIPRIYSCGLNGPWQKIGYVYSDKEEPKDRTMQLYAQAVSNRQNRFNYRVTDTNSVPIEIRNNSKWLNSGDTVRIDGRSDVYTVKIYRDYA